MSKTNTKANINANIKTNGNQSITGSILNSVLNTMVDDYAEQTKVTELESEVSAIIGGELTATYLADTYIPNGLVTAMNGQKCYFAKVLKGQTLTLDIVKNQSAASIRTGVFSSVPQIGVQATEYATITNGHIVFEASEDIYYAFAIFGTYLTSFSFMVDSLTDFEAKVGEIDAIKESIGDTQTAITMVNGFYTIGNKSVGGTMVDSVTSSSSYKCAKIQCRENDVFVITAAAGSTAGIYAFVDSNLTILSMLASSTASLNEAEITAPSGSAFLFLNDNTNSTSYKGKGDNFARIDKAVSKINKSDSLIDSFSLSASATKRLATTYVRKNSRICAILGAFSSIRIGVGYNTYKGAWIEVDATNVKVYDYVSNATQTATYAHGLNVANGAEISIVANTNSASIIIVDSLGNVSKRDNVAWWGGGSAFITNLGSGAISGTISFNASDLSQSVWIFGDSYLSYNSQSRWLYYMLDWGFDKWLANHLPGISSTPSLECFKNLIKLGRPQYVVWTLGMNDGSDTNANTPNADWLNAVNAVLSYCDTYGVTPILATIPTSSNNDGSGLKNNEGKNAWVRASGCRYIDFANAVGANGDGTWRSGLKDTDIHPTSQGAKVLASRVLIDFAEIMK